MITITTIRITTVTTTTTIIIIIVGSFSPVDFPVLPSGFSVSFTLPVVVAVVVGVVVVGGVEMDTAHVMLYFIVIGVAAK